MKPNLLLLADELEQELLVFQQVETAIQEPQIRLLAASPALFDLYAIGHILDDLYNGMERICHRVVKKIDQVELDGSNWHRELLDRVGTATGSRPAVIHPTTLDKMHRYRGFRHRIRHMYGFELDWEKMQPLFDGAQPMLIAFTQDLNQFVTFLRMIAADNDDDDLL
ncbi:MAG: hypothetical protein H6668_25120 [Ardenticatenaceae bacterium]|nr:hypothetical protein [Ardenticatenaceae bacterium]